MWILVERTCLPKSLTFAEAMRNIYRVRASKVKKLILKIRANIFFASFILGIVACLALVVALSVPYIFPNIFSERERFSVIKNDDEHFLHKEDYLIRINGENFPISTAEFMCLNQDDKISCKESCYFCEYDKKSFVEYNSFGVFEGKTLPDGKAFVFKNGFLESCGEIKNNTLKNAKSQEQCQKKSAQ